MKGFVRRRTKRFPSKPILPPVRVKQKPSFFQKHRVLSTYLGASILFATFVVKDWKQQHLRDEIDELRSAQQTLLIVSEAMRSEMGQEPSLIGRLDPPNASRLTVLEYQRSLSAAIIGLSQAAEESRGTAQAMSEVELALNKYDSFIAPLDEYVRTENSAFTESKSVFARLKSHLQPLRRESSTGLRREVAFLNELAGDCNDINMTIWAANRRVTEKANNLSMEAFRRKLRLETEYMNWEYLGYLLYAFGWWLALHGRLAGNNELTAE